MNDTSERFSEEAAEIYVASTCFKTGPPRAVGIELEWILRDRLDPARRLTHLDLDAALAAGADLTSGRLTVEPGGQLELSSHPFPDPAAFLPTLEADLRRLRTTLARSGLALSGVGLDPWRAPHRLLELPRYVAMEQYFDRRGRAGRTMMSATAAIQVNLDAGIERASAQPQGLSTFVAADGVDLPTRWALLHELVPVLVAAFANSPVGAGRATGLRGSRAAVWRAIDPARTRPAHSPNGDPRATWTAYALDAPMMCIPAEGPDWSAPPELTFRAWLRGEGPRPAAQADLVYHLTTLFPPVRPRGHLELRVIDAQRTDGDTAAALALVWALCTDPAAADQARAALEPVPAQAAVLDRAQRDAMTDGPLATATAACFDAASGALDRLGGQALRPALESFQERYVERGRCPADDTLVEWRAADARSRREEAARPLASPHPESSWRERPCSAPTTS